MEERPRNGKITDFNKPFIEQRADPFVMRAEDGKYYFTASVPAYDKIILRCSNTLKGLKDAKEKVIWTKHESGEMSRHISGSGASLSVWKMVHIFCCLNGRRHLEIKTIYP